MIFHTCPYRLDPFAPARTLAARICTSSKRITARSVGSLARILPREQVQIIVRSRVPLGEDEEAFDSIRVKVDRKQALSRQEEKLLERLAGSAKKWEDEVKSSAETEPGDTLGG